MRFDAGGTALGSPAIVDTTADGEQSNSAVAALEDGGWVVVWQSDYDDDAIFMQRYDEDGVAVGSEVRVNTTTSGTRSAPDIATLANGNWVVVWQGNGAGDDAGIFLQLYNSAGEPIGSEYLVNSVTSGSQVRPSVTALADGSWVVTWDGNGTADSEGVYQRIFSRGSIDAEGYDSTISVSGTTTLRAHHFEKDVDLTSSVVIIEIPDSGELTLDGAAVSVGQEIPITDVLDGLLAWTPSTTPSMTGDMSLSFVILDQGETYMGNESVNVLTFDQQLYVASELEDQVATEDALFSFTIPSDTFRDPEGGTLSYTATLGDGSALPGWLTFNDTTGTFSGTPTNSYVGTTSVKVTAHGAQGDMVSSLFDITVANIYNPPSTGLVYSGTYAYEDELSWFDVGNVLKDAGSTSLTYTVAYSDGSPVSWLTQSIYRYVGHDYVMLLGAPGNDQVGNNILKITATDSSGGSVSFNYNLTVFNINDAPTLANAIANQTANEDSAFSYTLPANTFADVDMGDMLTYAAQLAGGGALPSWLSFNAATRTFSGTPANGDVGTVSVDVITSDGNGGTMTDTFDITVIDTNDAPQLTSPITNRNATEDTAFNFQFAAGVFADVDVGDTLTYTAQLAGGGMLPTWLAFDAATRTFSGTPANGDVGTVSVEIIADDGNGGTVTDVFEIVVAATNDTPEVMNAIADQRATEAAAFSFQFAANSFVDIDVGDTLSFSAQLAGGGALPSWLSFDAATRTFSGTPANGDVGTISVEVIAADGNGGTVTDTFDLVVSKTVRAPVVSGSIAGQAALEDQPFTFQFGANVFTDPDVGDILSYSARLADGSGLPAWLHFDATSRTFSGTPVNDDTGLLSIDVIATDTTNLSVSTRFDITIAPVNDAPTASGGTVAVGSVHVFSASDFGYSDTDGDDFRAIVIGDLPGAGKLLFDGRQVASGTEIDIGDISHLKWTPKANGASDAIFSFFVIDDGGTDNGGVDRSTHAATITLDVLDRIVGGAGKQMLKGAAGDDILIGGRGNDRLTGGRGSDTFVFKTGDDRDVILDFQAKSSGHDILDLTGLKSISGFGDLMANHAEAFKGGVRIDAGNCDVIILQGVKLNHLDAGDFLF